MGAAVTNAGRRLVLFRFFSEDAFIQRQTPMDESFSGKERFFMPRRVRKMMTRRGITTKKFL